MSQLSLKLGLGIGQNNHMVQLAIPAQVDDSELLKGSVCQKGTQWEL